MKDGETIIFNGEAVTVYLCDRKDTCNKSKSCGKECIFTLKEEHREPQTSLFNQ